MRIEMEDYIICRNKVFRVGEIYELYFNPDNRNNTVFQIRAIIDDEWVALKYEDDSYSLKHESWFFVMKNNLTFTGTWR